jgi:hypothetical protein
MTTDSKTESHAKQIWGFPQLCSQPLFGAVAPGFTLVFIPGAPGLEAKHCVLQVPLKKEATQMHSELILWKEYFKNYSLNANFLSDLERSLLGDSVVLCHANKKDSMKCLLTKETDILQLGCLLKSAQVLHTLLGPTWAPSGKFHGRRVLWGGGGFQGSRSQKRKMEDVLL